MTDQTWHCQQIPNGMDPIVVCEREDLLKRIEELEAELKRLRDVWTPLEVTHHERDRVTGWVNVNPEDKGAS